MKLLPGPEINYCQPVCLRVNQWLLIEKGFNYISPQFSNTIEAILEILFTEMKIDKVVLQNASVHANNALCCAVKW